MNSVVGSYLEDELLYRNLIITSTEYKQIRCSLTTACMESNVLGIPGGSGPGYTAPFILPTYVWPLLRGCPTGQELCPKQKKRSEYENVTSDSGLAKEVPLLPEIMFSQNFKQDAFSSLFK